MSVNVIKVYADGSEAHSQTFDDDVQAELYLHKYRDDLIAGGHEIIEEGTGLMVAKINGNVFRYEVRG